MLPLYDCQIVIARDLIELLSKSRSFKFCFTQISAHFLQPFSGAFSTNRIRDLKHFWKFNKNNDKVCDWTDWLLISCNFLAETINQEVTASLAVSINSFLSYIACSPFVPCSTHNKLLLKEFLFLADAIVVREINGKISKLYMSNWGLYIVFPPGKL